MAKKVYVMRGQSGSGKTTYAQNRWGASAVVCSADHFWLDQNGNYNFDGRRIGESHGFCMRKFIDHCRSGTELIVVDNTNTTIAEMAPYVAVGNAYGYEVEIVNIVTPVEVSAPRNVHAVPTEVVMRQHSNMLANTPLIPPYWKMTSIVYAQPITATAEVRSA